MNYVDSDLEVISRRSELDFDVDTELNASETTLNSGPRTHSEHGITYQMSTTGVLSSVPSLSALPY